MVDGVEMFEVPVHPKRPEYGVRKVPFGESLMIDRDDFMEEPVPGFRRLTSGGQVRLKFGYVITCDEVVKDVAGQVVELKCRYHPDTRAGVTPKGQKKVKGIIHWLEASQAVPAEVRLYDRLFTSPAPGADEEDGDFLKDLNPASIEVLTTAFVEPAVGEWSKGGGEAGSDGGAIQFERCGYFSKDFELGPDGQIAFNRVVTLRDTWAADAGGASGGGEKSAAAGEGAAKKSGAAKKGGAGKAATAAVAGAEPEAVEGKYQFGTSPDVQQKTPDEARVELRVGKVLSAAPHPDAESLFVEEIDVGDEEGPRTVVSGLAKWMSPDDLVGKDVVVVCNLKPAKMRGIESVRHPTCPIRKLARTHSWWRGATRMTTLTTHYHHDH